MTWFLKQKESVFNMPIRRSRSGGAECSICGRVTMEFGCGEGGATYCPECIKELHMVECSHDGCGKYLKPEEAYLSGRGFLCKHHWEEAYGFCSECGALIQKKYGQKINGNLICSHCFEAKYFKCDECGEIYPLNKVVVIEVDGQTVKICKSCRENHYMACPECHKVTHISDIIDTRIHGKGNTVSYFVGCRSCIEKKANRCRHCGKPSPR